jgi:hypothetical protein
MSTATAPAPTPEAPTSIKLGGATYVVHKPRSAAQAASVFSGQLDHHTKNAAIIGLCTDAHGVPWQGKAVAFGERVFDALQAKGVTFQQINAAGDSLAELAVSVVLLEREVAAVEDFTAAPQAD